MSDAPILSVDEVSISFTDRDDHEGAHTRKVVDRVSFDLEAGRVLALVGESGSGKSVTAMSTLGLLPAGATVTGSVRLQGEELLGATPARLRQVRGGSVGTVFQEPMTAFNPVITIGRQIAEALAAHGLAGGRANSGDRVSSLLASVGIADPARVARSHPHELSGGQLQRAMIAMAISCDPVALIADEPTTALDVTVQAGILDLIRELRDRLGTAVLLITHDMGVVADLADDVVVMREGRVVERADASELFAHPTAEYTQRLLAAVPRLDALRLTDPAVVTDRAHRPVADAADASVARAAARLDGASVIYGGRGWGSHPVAAVDDVTLLIEPGQIFGLVGESGSGKSTIGRALAGLVPLSSGSATVDGVELAHASRGALRAARSRIGYIFQDPASSLNPRATVGQSIAEPLKLHAEITGAQRRERVRELLSAVQLDTAFADRYQHELSGGQRQRVAIARAIALRPALLIADEPTSALDVSVQATVLDLLHDLQDHYGFACLFISHDLAVVHDLADQVAVMHDGRIVETGTTASVLRSPSDPYTQRLLAAAPVPDPEAQRVRREEWRALVA
ncbi:ABC transporter ATP-binding protein [Diaminobutyricibacter sp. McL0608]|uniref:ABC transporter ATP-binding protein n=1 Tax=Leifsonia sp. McL0608 TaxID=3143537 RepID=UPI0031F2E08D